MKRIVAAATLTGIMVAGVAHAANVGVGVNVATPNASGSVRVGSQPPPPRVMVVEKERVVVHEVHHDNGKHKGHYKKGKKGKKHD